MLSLASAQCVQQLQLSASVYTVGAILLSERLIDTKSRMVMKDDSEDSADGVFQTRLFHLSMLQFNICMKRKQNPHSQNEGRTVRSSCWTRPTRG